MSIPKMFHACTVVEIGCLTLSRFCNTVRLSWNLYVGPSLIGFLWEIEVNVLSHFKRFNFLLMFFYIYSGTTVVTYVRAGTTVTSTCVCETGCTASQTVAAKFLRFWLKHFVGSIYRLQRTTTARPVQTRQQLLQKPRAVQQYKRLQAHSLRQRCQLLQLHQQLTRPQRAVCQLKTNVRQHVFALLN